MSRILVIDDEPAIGWGLKEYLGDLKHDVRLASSVEAAWDSTRDFNPDAILVDVRLPGQDGLSAISDFRHRWGPVPVVVMTAFGDLQTAVHAVQQGAFEYLTKPFDLEEAGAVIRRALESPALSVDRPARGSTSPMGLLGSSAAMQEVYKKIALVAASEIPLLITGESGTGKELAAIAIHRHSHRSAEPFIPLSLASISPLEVEKEFFGCASRNGSVSPDDRPGLIELAANGTLFLDDIELAPLALQTKLLRLLESRQYAPVGDARWKTSRVRVIAASRKEMTELHGRADFMPDLLTRLSGYALRMPPLRERPEDIPQLAELFWRAAFPHQPPSALPADILSELQRRSWPGNVRELRRIVEYVAVVSRGVPLTLSHLPAEFVDQPLLISGPSLEQSICQWVQEQPQQVQGELYRDFLSKVEPILFAAVLEECQSNRAATARRLGLDRTTLRTKLRAYGMDSDSL